MFSNQAIELSKRLWLGKRKPLESVFWNDLLHFYWHQSIKERLIQSPWYFLEFLISQFLKLKKKCSYLLGIWKNQKEKECQNAREWVLLSRCFSSYVSISIWFVFIFGSVGIFCMIECRQLLITQIKWLFTLFNYVFFFHFWNHNLADFIVKIFQYLNTLLIRAVTHMQWWIDTYSFISPGEHIFHRSLETFELLSLRVFNFG